jgi:hypothetical protein
MISLIAHLELASERNADLLRAADHRRLMASVANRAHAAGREESTSSSPLGSLAFSASGCARAWRSTSRPRVDRARPRWCGTPERGVRGAVLPARGQHV